MNTKNLITNYCLIWLSNVDCTNLGNYISLISSSIYFKCFDE